MPNLMQSSMRDFSISIMKNIPYNKILWCFLKKYKESQEHSVDREQYAIGKKVYIYVWALEIFDVNLRINWHTCRHHLSSPG